MSGTRAITLTLDVRGAEQVQAALRQIGPVGEEALRRLDAAAQRSTAGTRALIAANENATGSFRGIGNVATSAGFQLQDFATQVAGGTSALTAFAQQAPQFLGVFGTGGAIAGAIVAVGALAFRFLSVGENAEEAAKSAERNFKGVADSQRDLARAIQDVNDLYLTQSQRAAAAAAASRTALSGLLGMTEGQLIQRNEGNAIDLVAAQRALADAEAAIRRRQEETFARTGSRVSDADRDNNFRLFSLRAAVDGINADIGRVSSRLSEVQAAQARLRDAPAEQPRDPERQRSSRGPIERAPGDAEGVLDRLRQKIEDDARRVTESVDPAARALRVYQEGVENLRRAEDLYRSTQDREGGPLGISPEAVERAAAALKGQYVDAVERANTAGRSASNTFDQFFSRAASGFEQAIINGSSFSDVMKSLDRDIATLILRMAVLNPLADAAKNAFNGAGGFSGIASSIFGSLGFGDGGLKASTAGSAGGYVPNAMGGIMTEFGSVPLRRYARGGIANSPQLAMFGEGSTAEAYVPLPDGRRIPVEQRGGGGTTVMIDARGAEVGVEARIEAGIRRAIPGIVSITKGSLATDVNRGGTAARTMGRRAA
jgi:prefoldin subunit 5